MLRASAITVAGGGHTQTLQKNEDTWCGVLWHYDAEDSGNPADNPEIARGFEGW
ncbi:MAG TPA: hypothetical protein VJI70_00930 [Candidatus Paceibacterota bacterium]